jgi:hypothetical protein
MPKESYAIWKSHYAREESAFENKIMFKKYVLWGSIKKGKAKEHAIDSFEDWHNISFIAPISYYLL